MKLIQWSFHNISMPMMEDDEGELYCTSEILCSSLGITKEALKQVAQRHADELAGLRVTNCNSKEFIINNKEQLGIRRLRKDMRLWTEDDMLLIAMFSKSGVSKEFRQELLRFIKTNARRGYVSIEQHEALSARLLATQEDHQAVVTRLEKLESIVELSLPALKEAASAAGTALAAQRGTKAIRYRN